MTTEPRELELNAECPNHTNTDGLFNCPRCGETFLFFGGNSPIPKYLDRIYQLKLENLRLKAELNVLYESDLYRQKEEIKRLEADIERFKQITQDAISKGAELKLELEQAKAELEHMKAERDTWKDNFEIRKNFASELETKFDVATNSATGWMVKYERQRDENLELKKMAERYREKLLEVLDLCDHCADFSSGVVFAGVDEGESQCRAILNEVRAALDGEKK